MQVPKFHQLQGGIKTQILNATGIYSAQGEMQRMKDWEMKPEYDPEGWV